MKNNFNIESIAILFFNEFQDINPINKISRVLELIDLKKFINNQSFSAARFYYLLFGPKLYYI